MLGSVLAAKYRGKNVTKLTVLSILSNDMRVEDCAVDAFRLCMSRSYADSPELEDIISNVKNDSNYLMRSLRSGNSRDTDKAIEQIKDDISDLMSLPDYQIDELFEV